MTTTQMTTMTITVELPTGVSTERFLATLALGDRLFGQIDVEWPCRDGSSVSMPMSYAQAADLVHRHTGVTVDPRGSIDILAVG